MIQDTHAHDNEATNDGIEPISEGDTPADDTLADEDEVPAQEVNDGGTSIEALTSEMDDGSNGDEDDEAQCQTPDRLLKTLRELGLSKETRAKFKIKNAYKVGLIYPVEHLNAGTTEMRFYGVHLNPPAITWARRTVPDLGKPRVYNVAVLRDFARIQDGLFIVSNEVDVWIMDQNGLPAICCIEPHDFTALSSILVDCKVPSVKVICEDTLEGRHALLNINKELTGKVPTELFLLERALGASMASLSEQVGCNTERFCDEIEMLPRVLPQVLDWWQSKPEAMNEGLPLPDSESNSLLPCFDEDELSQLARPQTLIEGVLLAGKPTLLSGKHASGKSFVALGMGLSISQGIPWHGRRTQAGAVFYFSAEGTEGIRDRLRAWKQKHAVARVPNFAVVKDAVDLGDAGARRNVINTVRARLQKMGLAPDGAGLLVFDTLARYRGALDENSANEMGRFMDATEEVGRELGAAVLLIHHNNRSGEHRGSSVLPANADGHIEVSSIANKKAEGGQQIKVQVAKMKDYSQGHSIVLGTEIVTLDGVDAFGKPLTSLVLTLDEGAESDNEKEPLSEKEEATLRALVEVGEAGATSGVWKKGAAANGVSSSSFDRARGKLLDLGAVKCENPGATGAIYKAVEDWVDSPDENDPEAEDEVIEEDDAVTNDEVKVQEAKAETREKMNVGEDEPLEPYHYQLREGDPEVDEWYPVGEWIVRFRRRGQTI